MWAKDVVRASGGYVSHGIRANSDPGLNSSPIRENRKSALRKPGKASTKIYLIPVVVCPSFAPAPSGLPVPGNQSRTCISERAGEATQALINQACRTGSG